MIAETASATVKAIDPATRTLTLATEGGEDVSIQCGKNVVNFDQIKVGDTVRIQECAPISKTKRWTVVVEA